MPGSAAGVKRNEPTPRTHLASGDILRGIAALSVFAYHAAFVAGITRPTISHGAIGRTLQHLDLGLYLFFALSGYLVGGPVVRSLIDDRPGRPLRMYARKRMLRIVPALWAVAAVIALGHSLLLETGLIDLPTPPARDVVAIFGFAVPYVGNGFTPTMGQAWTLSVELAFYALVPLGGLLGARSLRRVPGRQARARWLAAAVVGLAIASLALRASLPATLAWRRSIPTIAVAFTPGVLLAIVEHGWGPFGRRTARLAATGLAAVAVGAALGRVAVLGNRHDFWVSVPWTGAASATLCAGAVVAAASLTGAGSGPSLTRRLLAPVDRLGVWSYSFYLLHQAVFVFTFEALDLTDGPGAFVLLVAIGLPVSAALACVSYELVERRFHPTVHRRAPHRTLVSDASVPGGAVSPPA